MKPAGLRNALLFFVGGLITWGLLIWLPHRELGHISGYLGRPENLPTVSRGVYGIQQAIYSARWYILVLFPFVCIAYYFFYNWASTKDGRRMLIHNIALFVLILAVYGLLIYTMVGVRVALRGIGG